MDGRTKRRKGMRGRKEKKVGWVDGRKSEKKEGRN